MSFNKLSELLPAFTCARAFNFWSICVIVDILNLVLVVGFNGSNPLLKALITNSLP